MILDTEDINLTRGHYAALRAWYQGLSLDLIATRYLGFASDEEDLLSPVAFQAQLKSIHRCVIERAYRHDRADLATHLSANFKYSEKDIIKAIDAVHSLESLGSAQPALHHVVQHWFSPALAKRLHAADLNTIGKLISACNDRGYGWWRRVPRIGGVAAEAIVNWLISHESKFGRTIGAHVTRKLSMPALDVSRLLITLNAETSAIPPLEAMRLPASLNGGTGSNRAALDRCSLTARNDYEAVLTWLSLRPKHTPTYKAYRKEVERFLAWAVIERGKALSSLTTEDCIAYRDFLADPQPASRWCAAGVFSRTLPGWRPFTGSLTPDSQKYAQTVLSSFCEFLTKKRYLETNPWFGIPPFQRGRKEMQIEKALPFDVWLRFWSWLCEHAEHSMNSDVRLARAAIALLRDSGLRRGEACSCDRADLLPIAIPKDDVWGEIRIVGKGDRVRRVPVSTRTIEALRVHWNDRAVSFDLAVSGSLLSPLFMPKTPRAKAKHARGETGFSASGLRLVVVRAAERFAASLSDDEKALAACAARTRPHALRHTFAVHGVEAGMDVDVLQSLLGHSSMSTTTIYTQPGRERRLRQIAKLYK